MHALRTRRFSARPLSNALLELNNLHLAEPVTGPRVRKLKCLLKRVMVGGVEEARWVSSISDDEFVNDVFDLGVILPGDGYQVDSVAKKVLDQLVERGLIPRRAIQNDTFTVSHC
jgi:hypothetical protein